MRIQPRQFIRREDGQEYKDASGSCPKCGHHQLKKTLAPDATFDEGGWYHALQFSCQSLKCGHQWTEKQSVVQGNKPLR